MALQVLLDEFINSANKERKRLKDDEYEEKCVVQIAPLYTSACLVRSLTSHHELKTNYSNYSFCSTWTYKSLFFAGI